MKKLTRPWLQRRLIQRARWHPSVAGRFCENPEHLVVRAADRCDACGHPLCDACLQPVELWRVCGPCPARLRRERDGPSWPQRWRRRREARRSLAAGGVLLLLLAVVVALLQGGFGAAGAASGAHTVLRALAWIDNGSPVARRAFDRAFLPQITCPAPRFRPAWSGNSNRRS